MKSFEGHVAVVTGASSGIGRQLAIDLAARGAKVFGVARRATDAPNVEPVRCDVSDADAFRAVLDGVGVVDVLVNGAALEQRTPVEDADVDLYHRTFALNFFAAVTGTLAVVPGMLERGRGVVLNISSDHGRAPAPGTPAYSASKAALAAFTEAVAHEVKERGVHLHVLYPGWVPTSLGQGAVDQGMPQPPRAVRRTAEQVSRLALDRVGGAAVDINAARVAVLAPVMRALAPRFYARMMRKHG